MANRRRWWREGEASSWRTMRRLSQPRETVSLECGHSRTLPAEDARHARQNGWLYCPQCGYKTQVKEDT